NHFKDERRLYDGNGGGILREDLVHPLLLGGDHGRVNDGVEVVEAAALEGEFGEADAIEAAIGAYDFRAECADDLGVDKVAGFHHFAAEGVGFNNVRAQFTQECGDGAFAAAEAACESYAE